MASTFDEETGTPEFGNLASLAENLVYRLPGCSDLYVTKVLRDVYRDFCRRSCCLRTTRRLLLEDGVLRYPIVPIYGQRVDSIAKVVSTWNRREFVQGRDYEVLDGDPVCISIRGYLVPANGCGRFVLVTTIEAPSLESDKVPSWFLQKHGDAVCDGVMARMTVMQNRPWSDPQSASQYRLSYENAVGAARLSMYGGGQFGLHPHDNPLASELV